MDVRCERCKTEYEFDDARITEAGVTVKCTSCGHVFRVKKKALVVTVPVKPVEAAAPQPPPAPPPVAPTPPPEKPREWKVRQANGNVFTFKELTTLQKWIVERKVARDDEISLTGETWKRLGNIAELASFFQVVEEAQKAAQLQALQAQGLLTSAPASPPAPAPAPAPAPVASAPVVAAPVEVPTPPPPEAPDQPAPVPQTHTPEPRFVQDRMAVRTAARREDDDDFEAAGLKRSGGAGKWIAALLLLGALGAGGYYGYFHYWLPLQEAKPVVVVPPAAPPEQTAAPSEDAGTEPESAAATPPDAGSPEAVAAVPVAAPVEAEPAPTPAPAPEVVPAAAVAPAPKKEPVRDFDGWVTQGDRLRMRDRAEQAIEAYDKAIALKPTRAEPIAGRGLALLDLGDRSAAEQAFREALRHNPRYAVAIMGLAETLRQTNRNTEAVEQYQRYLEILPNGPEAPVAKAAIERLKE